MPGSGEGEGRQLGGHPLQRREKREEEKEVKKREEVK